MFFFFFQLSFAEYVMKNFVDNFSELPIWTINITNYAQKTPKYRNNCIQNSQSIVDILTAQLS